MDRGEAITLIMNNLTEDTGCPYIQSDLYDLLQELSGADLERIVRIKGWNWRHEVYD